VSQSVTKDTALAAITECGGNVAQFISWGPDGQRRHGRIRGLAPDSPFDTDEAAVRALMAMSSGKVNVRTFTPEQPDGNPFFYGLASAEAVLTKLYEMTSLGYYVIVNELIDVADGGFSGVRFGNLVEFAPGDTPRCVEKPGTARMSWSMMARLIRQVYGFNINLPFPPNCRVEFSVHPGPVGYTGRREIIWQVEEYSGRQPEAPALQWPNLYSQAVGDKAFGLLVAHLLGYQVPFTTVFSRRVPLFEFGTRSHSNEDRWVRTAPRVQEPGLFTTQRGWLDPFALMVREDPEADRIAAILVQDGIAAQFSGAAITDANGRAFIEGKAGYGDMFMVGEDAPVSALPARVIRAVKNCWESLVGNLGPVRFEWVFDGNDLWVVQLHVGQTETAGDVICPGEAATWLTYSSADGLDGFRVLVRRAASEGFGITLHGNVGITSHWCDLLRRYRVPSRLVRP
jgi:hypothetical protein